jgi:DUF4097 and DUF4098 domain-containing protein YvlB
LVAGLLILLGSVIIVSTLFKARLPQFDFGGLLGGLIGGLILSLLITSGFNIITDVFDSDSLGGYTARDTKTFHGAITAKNIFLEIENFNGPISVSTWSKSEYNVELEIRSKREEYLDEFNVEFDIMETQTMTQGISLSYNIPQSSRSRYAVSVEVFLPEDVAINLNLRSSNGGIVLSDVAGDRMILRTSNGRVELNDVYFDEIDVETSNGAISGRFEASETHLSTSNGAINLKLPCTISGNYRLSTSNGRIDLEVSSDNFVGYDLELSTSNADISIDLPQMDYSTNQRMRKVAKTDGFSSKSIQIIIEANTSNGNIAIDT